MDSLTEQGEAPASQSTPPPRNFDFPTLNGDGSVPDLIETHPPPGQRTPPAALSTLALKMENTPNSLDDGQYDMVDDALSNDGETASIASTTDDFEDDIDSVAQLTPDENGSVVDEDEVRPTSQPSTMLSSIQLNKARLQYEAAQKQDRQCKEEAMDSFLSEDLETPRQSTINRFPLQPEFVDTEHSPPPTFKSVGQPAKSDGKYSAAEMSHPAKILGVLVPSLTNFLFWSAVSLLSLSSLWLLSKFQISLLNDVGARRDALSASLVEWTNTTDVSKIFNLEHLLPKPFDTSSTQSNMQVVPDVHFQAATPNYIVVSFPLVGQGFPQPQSISVTKVDKQIDFIQRKLIAGVYGIAIDPKEAYGLVTVNMPCTRPPLNVTVSHNFGRRYLQLQKAQKELSETVIKDVAVARKAAKGLTDLFQLELGAGVAATKNVTNQLALQVSRDLQIFANTAASVFGKAAAASNQTAQHIRKDLQLARKDIIKASNDAKELIAAVKDEIKENFKTAVTEPLLLSRERALMLKDKLLGRKTKQLSICRRAGSKAGTTCKACKSCKHGKSNNCGKLTPSKQFKELKPGRRYGKHEQKQAPQILV